MKTIGEFKSLFDLLQAFPTEESCIEYLEKKLWNGTPVSPYDPTSKVYRRGDGMYRCKNTGKNFNIRIGTMFEGSKAPLRKWFMAIYLITSHKKGISSLQLAKDISVTQKTAWHMLHRIRECFDIVMDEKLDGEIELDETFVGGKNKYRHKNKKVKNCQGSMTTPCPSSWRGTSPKPRNREDRKRKSSTLTGISPNSSTTSHWKQFSD